MCKLYVVTPGRRCSGAPRPAAGGAALVRRKLRWPNFIIWRWAGRALGGWIPCLRRVLRLHRVPHPLTSVSLLLVDGESRVWVAEVGRRAAHGRVVVDPVLAAGRERRARSDRPKVVAPSAAEGRRHDGEPRRALAVLRLGVQNPPREVDGAPLGRALAVRPLARGPANQQGKRARVARPHAGARRKDAAEEGASRVSFSRPAGRARRRS
jgi:hypothetical protein